MAMMILLDSRHLLAFPTVPSADPYLVEAGFSVEKRKEKDVFAGAIEMGFVEYMNEE